MGFMMGWLVLVYLGLRLVNLTNLAIFNDEAIYLHWGLRQVNESGQLFFSLFDGKQPLLMWIFGLTAKVISDPLLAGRLVSVVAGTFGLWGMYYLSKELFSKEVGWYAAGLYTLVPVFLFFDRQALMESVMVAVGIWSVYFLIKLIRSGKLKYGLGMGLVLGIGFMVKTSVLFYILGLLVLAYLGIKGKKEKEKAKLINYLFLSYLMFQIVVLPLMVQSEFVKVFSEVKNSISLVEVVKMGFKPVVVNIVNLVEVLFWQLTPLVFLAGMIRVIEVIKKKESWEKWFLISYGVMILLAIFAGRDLSPRHTVVLMWPLVILAANKLAAVKVKWKRWLVFISAGVVSWLLVFKPLRYFDLMEGVTRFSQKDIYVNFWTSGYGVEEARSWLIKKSKEEEIVIGLRLDAGIPESAMAAYFYNDESVKPTSFDMKLIKEDVESYDCLEFESPIYYVSRDGNLAGLEKFFVEVKRFGKPEGERYIGIHELIKKCERD